jgi:hypothetical protein
VTLFVAHLNCSNTFIAAPHYPRTLESLAQHIHQPQFPEALRRFLYDQLHPDGPLTSADVLLQDCPRFSGYISIYHSAIARFYAPSDLCGAGGMYREIIRACPAWRGTHARRDTVFVETDENGGPNVKGMVIGRVFLFFSFAFHGKYYPCALVQWFVPLGEGPDDDTGMWMVVPEFVGVGQRRRPSLAVVHLDAIVRGCHLLPVYGRDSLPENFHFSKALDGFKAFFVNKYSDHHTYELLS